MEEAPTSLEAELAQARQTIEEQAQEIERLRGAHASNEFADRLREAVRLADAAGSIAAPVTHSRLLDLIVATAAHVIHARAASLFLMHPHERELTFEVALGQKAGEVMRFKVPLGSGIAGLVAATGQPMAVSDAQHDPRHAADIAHRVGYEPQSILCVPMIDNDVVVGVLELLDKEGAPSFGSSDMAALSLFANPAAVAIQQSRAQQGIAGVLLEVLASIEGADGEQSEALVEEARAFAAEIEGERGYQDALALAQLVREVAQGGERELRLCHRILESVADYCRSRSGGASHGDLVIGASQGELLTW